MKKLLFISIILFLGLGLLLFSRCNQSSNDLEAKHKQDSLLNVLQVQQKQIASLKLEKREEQQKAEENRHRQLVAQWQRILQVWNTQLDVDNVKLANASESHWYISQSTQDQQVRAASITVQRDKVNIQTCQDSISKYTH